MGPLPCHHVEPLRRVANTLVKAESALGGLVRRRLEHAQDGDDAVCLGAVLSRELAAIANVQIADFVRPVKLMAAPRSRRLPASYRHLGDAAGRSRRRDMDTCSGAHVGMARAGHRGDRHADDLVGETESREELVR